MRVEIAWRCGAQLLGPGRYRARLLQLVAGHGLLAGATFTLVLVTMLAG
jgi:hypothetical protein